MKSNLISNLNKNIKNIFICNTPYHLIVSLSYILNFKLKINSTLILVDDGKVFKNIKLDKIGNYIEKLIILKGNEDVKNQNCFKKFIKYKEINRFNFNKIKNLKNDKFNVIYFIDLPKHNQFILNFLKDNCQSKFHLIEEGIGNYKEVERFKISIKNILVNVFMKSSNLKYVGSMNLQGGYYVKHPKLIDRKINKSIFLENPSSLIKNKRNEINKLFVYPHLMKIKNSLIYFSQPFDEIENFTIDDYLSVLNNLKKISILRKYELFIKPHPRDNLKLLKKIGLNILESIPSELIEFKDNSYGLTISSSSLISSGIKNKIFLYKIFPKIKVDKKIEEILLKEHCMNPKSFSDLSILIKDNAHSH